MTNEELAARVKAGKPGAMLELWEAVRRFVEMKARQRSRHPACATPYDDLVQAGFLAVLEAAQRYTQNDDYCFLTALGYYLRNHFAIEGGFKTSKRDALQYASSLDEPAKNDEGEAYPAVTCIIDEGAALAFDGVEYADFVRYARMVINAALDTLTERQEALLSAYYLDGNNMDTAATIAGFSCSQSASDAAERAAFRLSNGRYSRELRACLEAFNDYNEYHYAAQIGSFTRYQQSGISSTEAGALVK